MFPSSLREKVYKTDMQSLGGNSQLLKNDWLRSEEEYVEGYVRAESFLLSFERSKSSSDY